jgi:hypothetical protein
MPAWLLANLVRCRSASYESEERLLKKKEIAHLALNWVFALGLPRLMVGNPRTDRIRQDAGKHRALQRDNDAIGRAPTSTQEGEDAQLFERCCGSCRCLAEVSMTVRGRVSCVFGTLGLRNATFVALCEAAAVWPLPCRRG